MISISGPLNFFHFTVILITVVLCNGQSEDSPADTVQGPSPSDPVENPSPTGNVENPSPSDTVEIPSSDTVENPSPSLPDADENQPPSPSNTMDNQPASAAEADAGPLASPPEEAAESTPSLDPMEAVKNVSPPAPEDVESPSPRAAADIGSPSSRPVEDVESQSARNFRKDVEMSDNAPAEDIKRSSEASESDATGRPARVYDIPSVEDTSEESARKFFTELEPTLNDKCWKSSLATWEFVTDISPERQAKATEIGLDYSEFRKAYWKTLNSFAWRNFTDKTLRRQYYLESCLWVDILTEAQLKDLSDVGSKMKEIYSTAKICDYDDPTVCNLSLDPDITKKMSSSRNYEELKSLWIQWRAATGKKMPDLFSKYIGYVNEAAKLNGYHDAGELWRRPYQSDFMHLEFWALWGQIRPLYEQLHAYTRKKLRDFYQNEEINRRTSIPAHIFGNMWAQNWASLYTDMLMPYKNFPSVDITNTLREQNYTVIRMFEDADNFFTSLGLIPMTEGFWNMSIFQRLPPPTEMVCHPEAYDMCNKKDFAIKQCATVDMKDYVTAHHEMGHIEYYMQYKDLPNTFREGANPGFHEAIGDTISMSVNTPRHLKKMGLLESFDEDQTENTINFLMSQALKTLVDLPWTLTLEQWRWDVFSGKVPQEEWNCHWWKLRTQLQGIRPPVPRSSTDFDPGAKFHVPASVPYDRYFVARILTYQFHEALCVAAGEYNISGDSTGQNALHNCDIYNSKEAGEKLAAMLRLGSSKPWPEALEMITGTTRLNAQSIMNYYAPLMKWLQEENAKTNEYIGWDDEEDLQEQFCSTRR